MSDRSKPLIAMCDCSINAAQGEGAEAKLPSIEIEAYSGGVMVVSGWGPVAIDLTGLVATSDVSILYSHDTQNSGSILGQSSAVRNDGKTVAISGLFMADSETARNVKTLSKNGFKFQASVGVNPHRHSFVEAGVSIELNGQTLQGPFELIEAGEFDEVSIVRKGADGSTSAHISAEQAKALEASQEKEVTMSDTKVDKPIVASNEPTVESLRAAAVVESARISDVSKVAVDHPEIAAEAVKDGWGAERTEIAVLKAAAAIEAARNARPDKGITFSGFSEKEVSPEIIAAAVSLRAGLKDADKSFDADVCQKGHEMKVNTFTDLVNASMSMSGKRLDATRHDTREFLQAAFSTRSFANVLSNVANKFINQGFGMVEQSWREVAEVRSVSDFKVNTGVRLVMSDLLKTLGNGGEIEHGSMSDETRTVQAGTKALMLGVSRQDLINDDLGILSETPLKLGYASARTFNTDFWAALEAAVAANFTTGNGNKTTGALTLTTLAAAEKLFLALKDSDGNPLGTQASTLLCGGTAYTPAREIFASTVVTDGSTSKKSNANIYANMYKPVHSTYLSTLPWYLISNPMGVPLMTASFLNGQQEPTVESADADFNTLGIQMRAYYDYGCDFAEKLAGVYSTGA